MNKSNLYMNIKRHSAVDELRKLIKKLDYVEVNVNVLYNFLSEHKKLKEENEILKAEIARQKHQIQDEDFKNHNPKWVDIGFFIRYAKISRRKLRYAIENGYIKCIGAAYKRQIDFIEAINYFSQRKYNNKKEI